MRLIDIFAYDGKLYAWLHDGKNLFLECGFEPTIYAYASARELDGLARVLSGFGFATSFERRTTLKGTKRVLAITSAISGFKGLVRDLERHTRHGVELFHADLPLEEHYLFSRHVFPTCEVSLKTANGKVSSMSAREKPTDEYSLPEMRSVRLEVKTSYPLTKDLNARLLAVSLDGEEFGPDLLERFIARFKKADPDIIITSDGTLSLPYLLPILREVDPSFSFSRFGRDSFRTGGSTYTSYGQTIYKQRAVYLKGRLHLQRRGVLYGMWNLHYPFELARICRVSAQKVNHRSVGFGVANLQLYHAMRRGYLIPNKSTCAETWKRGVELFNADRGGLIYEPRTGFHTQVAEVDFTSMFPSIMVRHNISTETLFCRCCRQNRVPGLAMNICTKRRGIIPELLEPLIRQRLSYKSKGDELSLHKANALKGLLVTSFGYMGFRKSKFARIEAHQAIQAYARETLLAASRIAEERGFRVLHGYIDSLWVQKEGISEDDVRNLCMDIQAQLGFDIKIEGIYRWIAFLPSTQNSEVPVPTRYYGVFESGELKCRGIELRRHDTPAIIKEMQLRMIEELAPARSLADFRKLMRSAKRHLESTTRRIVSGNALQGELLITKGISKASYQSTLPQAVVVSKLRQRGFSPQPGHYLSYFVSHRGAAVPAARYAVEGDGCPYDSAEYARLARLAADHIFAPFTDDTKGDQAAPVPLQVAQRTLGEVGEKVA